MRSYYSGAPVLPRHDGTYRSNLEPGLCLETGTFGVQLQAETPLEYTEDGILMDDTVSGWSRVRLSPPEIHELATALGFRYSSFEQLWTDGYREARLTMHPSGWLFAASSEVAKELGVGPSVLLRTMHNYRLFLVRLRRNGWELQSARPVARVAELSQESAPGNARPAAGCESPQLDQGLTAQIPPEVPE